MSAKKRFRLLSLVGGHFDITEGFMIFGCYFWTSVCLARPQY